MTPSFVPFRTRFASHIFALPGLWAASCLFVGACATSPDQIAPSSINESAYARLSCNQLRSEWTVTKTQLDILADAQQRKAARDAAVATVLLVPTWPAVALNGDDQRQVTAIAKYQADLIAIDEIAARKRCPRAT